MTSPQDSLRFHGGDPEAFRGLARRWAASVTVVTVARHDGTLDGFTATGFLTVSIDPPIVMVSATRESSAAEMLSETNGFVVNLLAHHQRDLADLFATPHPQRDDPFARFAHHVEAPAGPRLGGTLGAFSARVRQRIDAGDHVLVLGDVIALHHGPDDAPLVYHNRQYGTVAPRG